MVFSSDWKPFTSVTGGSGWFNPGYMLVNDANNADTDYSVGFSTYGYLHQFLTPVTPFLGRLIGIEVTIIGRKGIPDHTDLRITLMKEGSLVGSEYVTPNISTLLGTYTLGGPTDLWGSGLIYSDLKHSNFGVGVRSYNAGPSSREAIQFVAMKYYYEKNIFFLF